jgi:DNA adenine methylase
MSNGKTFLRWAGSKKRLISKLRPYWGEGFRRYVEPFMGSAALFFALEPSEAVLSDINSALVETFCEVRDHPRAVYNRLLRLPLGEDAYYRIRQKDASQLSLLDRVARFVYLNRFCFNGLYRTNGDSCDTEGRILTWTRNMGGIGLSSAKGSDGSETDWGGQGA